MASEKQTPQLIMADYVLNCVKPYMIFAACEYDIFDHLHKSPATAHELAKSLSLHETSLYRLLRGLASIGYLKEHENGKFSVTQLGELLTENVEGSIKNPILYHFGTHCIALPKLSYVLKAGEVPFDHMFGTHYYDYLKKNPKLSDYCTKSLTQYAKDAAPGLINAIDFSPYKRIIDVGGGNGAFLVAILEKYTNATGVVFDEKHVIADAFKIIEESKAKGRCEAISGSFFDAIPANGDCYILKYILHNWDDENCLKILRNIRKQMKVGQKLIVLDDLLTDTTEPDYLKILDCLSMTVFSGKQRTRKEMHALFEATGFKSEKVVKVDICFTTVNEAVAV